MKIKIPNFKVEKKDIKKEELKEETKKEKEDYRYLAWEHLGSNAGYVIILILFFMGAVDAVHHMNTYPSIIGNLTQGFNIATNVSINQIASGMYHKGYDNPYFFYFVFYAFITWWLFYFFYYIYKHYQQKYREIKELIKK